MATLQLATRSEADKIFRFVQWVALIRGGYLSVLDRPDVMYWVCGCLFPEDDTMSVNQKKNQEDTWGNWIKYNVLHLGTDPTTQKRKKNTWSGPLGEAVARDICMVIAGFDITYIHEKIPMAAPDQPKGYTDIIPDLTCTYLRPSSMSMHNVFIEVKTQSWETHGTTVDKAAFQGQRNLVDITGTPVICLMISGVERYYKNISTIRYLNHEQASGPTVRDQRAALGDGVAFVGLVDLLRHAMKTYAPDKIMMMTPHDIVLSNSSYKDDATE